MEPSDKEQLEKVYIPNGKKIFFLREDLEQYLLKTRVKSYDEHDADADTFLNNKKLVR